MCRQKVDGFAFRALNRELDVAYRAYTCVD